MPRKSILFRYHPQYARHRAMGAEPRLSLSHTTEVYIVSDHPLGRVRPFLGPSGLGHGKHHAATTRATSIDLTVAICTIRNQYVLTSGRNTTA